MSNVPLARSVKTRPLARIIFEKTIEPSVGTVTVSHTQSQKSALTVASGGQVTHRSLQRTDPAGQGSLPCKHWPNRHDPGGSHGCPHAPQWRGSFRVSTHAPSQHVCPSPQPQTYRPPQLSVKVPQRPAMQARAGTQAQTLS